MDFIRWHIPKRVIYFQPPAKVTSEEYKAHNQRLKQMLDEGEVSVYMIVDLSKLRILPGHLSELMENNPLIAHPKLKHIIACGVGDGMLLLAGTMAKFVIVKAEVVKSYEEALEILDRLGVT